VNEPRSVEDYADHGSLCGIVAEEETGKVTLNSLE